MTTWGPVKLTAMQHQHIAQGATMADYAGWQRPSRYTSSEKEVDSLRKAAGICDISPVGKFYVQGSDASLLTQKLFPDAVTLAVGRAAPSSLLGQDGTILDQVIVCRFCDDEALIVSSAEKAGAVAQALKEHLVGCAHMVEMTSNFAAVNVVGPLSARLLSKLTDLDLSPRQFPDLSCAQGKMGEVYAIVLRRDQSGLPNYQVYFGRDFGEYVWEAMLEAGHELGLVPFGVEAMNLLAGGK